VCILVFGVDCFTVSNDMFIAGTGIFQCGMVGDDFDCVNFSNVVFMEGTDRVYNGRVSAELFDRCILVLCVECVTVFHVGFMERTDRQRNLPRLVLYCVKVFILVFRVG